MIYGDNPIKTEIPITTKFMLIENQTWAIAKKKVCCEVFMAVSSVSTDFYIIIAVHKTFIRLLINTVRIYTSQDIRTGGSALA